MENNKKIIYFLIIIIIIVGGYFTFFKKEKTIKEETIKTTEISREDIIVKELINKYGAITGLNEDLKYTIQAQERFIISKPIIFTNSTVDDIFNQNGKTFIRFDSSWFSENNFILELECNKTIIDKILLQEKGRDLNPWLDDQYIVVANIKEVIKPEVIELQGSLEYGDTDTGIYLNSYDNLIAKGVCVDAIFINNNE